MTANWVRLAELALATEGARPYGTAMARREQVARDLGVTRQTLSNYIAAYRFIDRVALEDPLAADDLRRLAATAVQIYSRWYERDPKAALQHARWAVANAVPVAGIAATEKVERERTAPVPLPSLLDRALASAVRLPATGIAPAGPQGLIAAAMTRAGAEKVLLNAMVAVGPVDDLARAAGVTAELRFEPSIPSTAQAMSDRPFHAARGHSGSFPIVGIIEAAPTGVADGHRRMGRSLLFRALGVAPLYPLSVVLLPDANACAEVVATLPDLDARAMGLGGVVPIVALEDGCALATVWQGSAGVLFAHPGGFARAYDS